jgi:hypothetical protein
MLYVSITEHHIATIWKFLSIEGDDESNVARNAFRLHFATSASYFYRLVLGAVAPMFVIWGLLALLVTALNTALLSGGLLLAPILAGLLVKSLGHDRIVT